jgi:hypothetical protein
MLVLCWTHTTKGTWIRLKLLDQGLLDLSPTDSENTTMHTQSMHPRSCTINDCYRSLQTSNELLDLDI